MTGNRDMIDMGMAPDRNATLASPATSQARISYPTFSVTGEVMDRILEACGDLDVDDEVVLACRVRVSGKSQDEFGKRLTLEVRGAAPDGEVEESADEEEEETDEKGKNPAREVVMKMRKGAK